jgi:hypothetical protein
MNKVACILMIIGASLVAVEAHTEGLACESIRDHDQRHYCRALATGSTTWCEVIRDGDLRQRCRAELAWRKR